MPRIISILSLDFPLREPYLPGSPLTPSEARALNALRAENIRNALYRRIKAAQAQEGLEVLRDRHRWEEIAEALDSAYTFPALDPVRPLGTSLRREAKRIGEERARAEAQAEGREAGDEWLEIRAGALAALPEVLLEAEDRLDAEAHAAQSALEDLLQGDV